MKFASSEIGSKIRNILIAPVLYKCGYIDAFGTGFDRTFTLCIKNNVDYEYKNDEFGFTFTFLRNPNFLNDKINDKINDLDKTTGKSQPTIYRHIEGLMKKDILKRMESRKTGYWEIIQ